MNKTVGCIFYLLLNLEFYTHFPIWCITQWHWQKERKDVFSKLNKSLDISSTKLTFLWNQGFTSIGNTLAAARTTFLKKQEITFTFGAMPASNQQMARIEERAATTYDSSPIREAWFLLNFCLF